MGRDHFFSCVLPRTRYRGTDKGNGMKPKGGVKRAFDLITKEGWKPMSSRYHRDSGRRNAVLVKNGQVIRVRYRHVLKAMNEIERRQRCTRTASVAGR